MMPEGMQSWLYLLEIKIHFFRGMKQSKQILVIITKIIWQCNSLHLYKACVESSVYDTFENVCELN